MSEAKMFEKLVGMAIKEDGEGDIVDTNAVNELRHLIMASDVKGIQDALTALKKPIKSDKTRISLAGLQVLGNLMENCSPSFHTAVASKDWMERLKKMVQTGDTVIKNTIMQYLVDWAEEFKFEEFGGIIKDTLSGLQKEGIVAPKSKAAERRMAVSPATPKQSAGSKSVPSTAEKAALPDGIAAQAPVSAGDDYWKAEAEKWRQRWETSAEQVMSMESICEKVRSGTGVADPATVIELAKAVDGTRIKFDVLKEEAHQMHQDMLSAFDDAAATLAEAVKSATASAAPAAAPAGAAPAPAAEAKKPEKKEEKPKEEKPKSAISKPKTASPKKEDKPKEGAKDPAAKPKRSPKARLTAYFKKHNPDKINSVDKLLASYKGKEEELFRKLADKYGNPVD